MDLSVIIVSYNTKKLTADAVNSVLSCADSLEKEIIVVDNDSKDGSVGVLKKLEKQKKIKLIINKDNLGFSKANNEGINIAKGRHILLLNSDTKVKNGALNNLVNFADKKADAGVIGSKLLNSDGSIQPSCLHFPTIINAIKQYWFGEKNLLGKFTPKGKGPRVVDAVVGASFLICRRALDKIGGLDERYFFYYEDLDYCRKVREVGLRVYYLPSSEVIHYHGASGKKIADESNQWRRLIPSSKIYHGTVKHYILFFIMWFGQKWEKYLKV